jgi:uncharacterized protein with ACT and thioredoxin-like domain
MFTKYDICTLTDVVIVDPIQLDLFSRSCAIQGFVAFDPTQVKGRRYLTPH